MEGRCVHHENESPRSKSFFSSVLARKTLLCRVLCKLLCGPCLCGPCLCGPCVALCSARPHQTPEKRSTVCCVVAENGSLDSKSLSFSLLATKTLLSNVLSTVLSSSCLSTRPPDRSLYGARLACLMSRIRKAHPVQTAKFAKKWISFQQLKGSLGE